MKLLKHLFLIKYIARQGVEILPLKKRLQKDISFQELVAGLEKLENAKPANNSFQFTMTIKFAASV
jgi:hypothetical protein